MGGAFSGILSQNFHRAGLRTSPFFCLVWGRPTIRALRPGPEAMDLAAQHTPPHPVVPAKAGPPLVLSTSRLAQGKRGPRLREGDELRCSLRSQQAMTGPAWQPTPFMHFRTAHPRPPEALARQTEAKLPLPRPELHKPQCYPIFSRLQQRSILDIRNSPFRHPLPKLS
jgi:hypothetical protein